MAMTDRSSGGRESRAWNEVGQTYRQAWERRSGKTGRWEDVEPAYRFSYEMARDPRYQGRSWRDVEPGLRGDFDGWAQRQGLRREQSTWDRLRDYAREGWELNGTLDRTPGQPTVLTEGERTLELREEQLIPHKELREVGEVQVRTQVEEVPGRLEVEAYREEVEIEHVPVGQVVSERAQPWEEDDVLIVPVYEEHLVMVKRLVLREHLKIRRVRTKEVQLFEDTLRRERVVVEDPSNTGLVHEQYPTDRTE